MLLHHRLCHIIIISLVFFSGFWLLLLSNSIVIFFCPRKFKFRSLVIIISFVCSFVSLSLYDDDDYMIIIMYIWCVWIFCVCLKWKRNNSFTFSVMCDIWWSYVFIIIIIITRNSPETRKIKKRCTKWVRIHFFEENLSSSFFFIHPVFLFKWQIWLKCVSKNFFWIHIWIIFFYSTKFFKCWLTINWCCPVTRKNKTNNQKNIQCYRMQKSNIFLKNVLGLKLKTCNGFPLNKIIIINIRH